MKNKDFQYAVIAHGGAGSNPENSDGPKAAITEGIKSLNNGEGALNVAVAAVKLLEDDPRFNAGIGSQIRCDGLTVQLDASCMTSDGNFGAVACVEGIQNPIQLAQKVLLCSPHVLIAGTGAQAFAKEHNIPVSLPIKKENHDINPSSCDTVGAIVFDGNTFAAALRSGGLENSPLGRVGDVPLPGCGLFCGSLGAVACTGDGEFIALKILAREVYGWIEQGISPDLAVTKALELFDDSVDIGLIILTKNDFASNSRNGMAWSYFTQEKE